MIEKNIFCIVVYDYYLTKDGEKVHKDIKDSYIKECYFDEELAFEVLKKYEEDEGYIEGYFLDENQDVFLENTSIIMKEEKEVK